MGLGSPPRPEVIKSLFEWEIAPLVHPEKFDMKGIESTASAESWMISHSNYVRADQ